MSWKCKLFGHKDRLAKISSVVYGVTDYEFICVRCKDKSIITERTYDVQKANLRLVEAALDSERRKK